jgi:hypothetical protein
MDDDPDTMLRQTLIICACFWLSALALVFLPACTPTATVQHEVPQLNAASDSIRKTSDSIRLAVDKIADMKPTPACPTLAMPPIPQECVIDIRGDSMTASSKDCEDLVRFYVAARRLLKPAAPQSTTQTGKP